MPALRHLLRADRDLSRDVPIPRFHDTGVFDGPALQEPAGVVPPGGGQSRRVRPLDVAAEVWPIELAFAAKELFVEGRDGLSQRLPIVHPGQTFLRSASERRAQVIVREQK